MQRIAFFVLAFLFGGGAFAADSVARVTLVYGIPTPIISVDPFSIAGIDAYTVTGNIIETLARSNPRTGEIVPVLAKSWSLDPKNKTFRVTLRENVVFHNGEKLSAVDVKFTFEAYFKPEYQAQIWQGMWFEIESVKVIDGLTAEFKMKNWRYQTFETAMTSLRILPKSFYDPASLKKFRAQIIGTGPFKQKSFQEKRGLEVEPHNQWWGSDRPEFALLFKHVPNAKIANEMMAKSALDFYALGEAKAPANQFLKKFASGLGSGLWMDFNLSNPLFQESQIRRALGDLWNREKMNAKIFGSQMELAQNIFSPATDLAISPTKNPKSPAEVFKSQGWTDTNKDGILDKDGRKFEFTVLAKSAEQERWLTFFQNDARTAGVKVHIQRVADDEQWLKRLKEGRFDAAAGGGGLINEPTALVWKTNAPYNFQKFSDAEVDRLTEQLEQEFDLKKRRLILRKTIARIDELRPYIPGLLTRYEQIFVSTRLKPEPTAPTQAWSWKLN